MFTSSGKINKIEIEKKGDYWIIAISNHIMGYDEMLQRIPVKIKFNQGTDTDHVLRIGISVAPTVIVK